MTRPDDRRARGVTAPRNADNKQAGDAQDHETTGLAKDASTSVRDNYADAGWTLVDLPRHGDKLAAFSNVICLACRDRQNLQWCPHGGCNDHRPGLPDFFDPERGALSIGEWVDS